MRNFLKQLSILLIVILVLVSCQNGNPSIEVHKTPFKQIFIKVDSEKLIQEALPGSDVQDFVKMYNGEIKFAARQEGVANLTTTLDPGDEIVWLLPENEGISLIDFKFHVLKGEDFFSGPDGAYPTLQTDGSWKARVTSNAKTGSVMKYDIYFEIEGVGTFWWDPVANIRSSDSE